MTAVKMSVIGLPKETVSGEKRRSALPINVKNYVRQGASVFVESGYGDSLHISDQAYRDAGAEVVARAEVLKQADIVLSLHKLPADELSAIEKENALVVSFLDPFNDPEYLNQLNANKLTSVSMEMIPRSSRCQKMDALSSQASLAGYAMVSNAVEALPKVLPMMMTPSGTIKPAKVFVIGAGVAGLQAIATAKRLGAAVTAYDTRPVVAEQVQSLGAKFLQIDLGETSETNQGYATALTPEQMQRQQEQQADCIADSDIVITTAQLFGRKPPRLINSETVARMRPGSVIVDMAAETGGNVEGSIAQETTVINGVTVIGTGAWANQLPLDASQMYSNNLSNLVDEFWDKDEQAFNLELEDEILKSSVITHQGETINEMYLSITQKGA